MHREADAPGYGADGRVTALALALDYMREQGQPAVPAPAAEAAVSAQARGLQAFAQLKPSEPRKPEPKPQHKRKIAKTRFAPPMVVVAQQPRFGFFGNDTW